MVKNKLLIEINEDLEKIEQRMHEIAKQDLQVHRKEPQGTNGWDNHSHWFVLYNIVNR